MKKTKITVLALLLVVAMILSSCATVLGGQVSTCQRTRPAVGQPQRSIRAAALIADVLICWPFAIVDFATGAIYKPCK